MKKSNLILIITMSLFFFGMSAWAIFADTPDYSDSERRVLASLPEFSVEAVLEGEFAEDFDDYTVDRFPARDMWRSIKAYASKAMLQKDNNGIYTSEGHISKIEYPMNTEMLDHVADVMKATSEKYLSGSDIYFVIVPDKNRYLAGDAGCLALDYEYFTKYMTEKMSFAKHIEIADLLSKDDYYYTDSHWRQEKIIDVAQRISSEMGVTTSGDFSVNTATSNFEGVYLGQSALKWQADTIEYLTNETIENAEVTLQGIDGTKSVYDMSKLEAKDPYEMFLSGNQPIVTVRNANNDSGKRLIMFRDSFASSLAPLMLDGYSEIVLVDLRYIPSSKLGEYIQFENADVLFIYSVNMMNNSLAIK